MSESAVKAWLSTATTRTEEVILFADQESVDALAGLYEEVDELNAEIEKQSKQPASSQRAIGDKSDAAGMAARVKELQDKVDTLEARAEESKSTWTLRALTRKEISELRAEYQEPTAPQLPPKAAPAKVKEKWERERDAWKTKALAIGEERTLAEISLAIVKVVSAAGETDEVSVEDLRGILDAEYGDYRINMLYQAVQDASNNEKGMARPK